jgi:NAD+ synthase
MELKKRIALWIRDRVKEAGAKGVVIGLSGGIDSSVVAALSRKAVGRNMLGLLIPCHSSERDIKDALRVARKFGIRTKTVDIAPLYAELLEIMPAADRRTRGNAIARLRMLTLYYFANRMNYIVAGTGNRNELFAGYFTKYGDGGVDILPIAGLLKNEVRELARQLGVPEDIVEKTPTAGLWEGQTDEGEMGISYDELTSAIKREEKGLPIKGKNSLKIKKMTERAKHKLKPIPRFER